MNKRPLTLLATAVLALPLSGCGDGGSDDSDSPSSSAAAESESSSAESEASPENTEATGEDYVDLAQALFDVEGPESGFTSAKEFNEAADFPDGVEVATFNQEAQEVCIQNTNLDIAFTLLASGDGELSLTDGTCKDGDEAARLAFDPKTEDLTVTGDKELAEPVREYALEDSEG